MMRDDLKLTVTKRFEFHYAHYLPEYEGKCKNVHGHTGILEVEVGKWGEVKEGYPEMVLDFGKLKKVVKDKVIDVLDHNFLNNILEIPTAEATALWIWNRLEEEFGQGLVRIRVYETPTSYAEVVRR